MVAVDGRGASGKSVLAEYLGRLLPEFTALNGDDYFEPTPEGLAWGDFNEERFRDDVITPLQRRVKSLRYRPYDWHADPPITEREVEVGDGLILERCFSFAFDLDWDLKIWVETPREICLERGIRRDLSFGDFPAARIKEVWIKVWAAREDSYVRAKKPREMADLILDGMRLFEEQLR